jgi:predicted Zn finger-like uncharacterized protein
VSDPQLSYTFTCPSCNGSFSIELERIPPVQARFRCPKCKHPMDFPSREEARVYASLQAQAVAEGASPRPSGSHVSALDETMTGVPGEGSRFRIEKPGFENDVFDRRAMRNLVRAGEVTQDDKVRVDDKDPVLASEITLLKSLFALRKTARITPPVCCRTHTDRVAHFQCNDTGRPLCEECGPIRKFGGTTIRVCQHCGGTAAELHKA